MVGILYRFGSVKLTINNYCKFRGIGSRLFTQSTIICRNNLHLPTSPRAKKTQKLLSIKELDQWHTDCCKNGQGEGGSRLIIKGDEGKYARIPLKKHRLLKTGEN